jgi:hypothetical protein
MSKDDGDGYKVGYGNPPRATRFKAGRSGNPKGRPKGSQNFATVLEKELKTRVTVTENGKRKTMTKQQAIVKQLVSKATAGDPKAIPILLNQARHIGEAEAGIPASSMMGPEDELVMESIIRRIRAVENPAPSEAAAPPAAEEPTEDPSEGGEP